MIKRIRIPRKDLPQFFSSLKGEYNRIKILFPGSPEHEATGLREDWVLIRAWKHVPRPDVSERMKRFMKKKGGK